MKSLLTLNTGSSSVKFRLFGLDETLPLLYGGKIADIGGTPVFEAWHEESGLRDHRELPHDLRHEDAVHIMMDWFASQREPIPHIAAAAHRIVHGGTRYSEPTELVPEVMFHLKSLNSLAPLHQPHNLAGADILEHDNPEIKQYGCFDTGFHARHDPMFYTYALPKRLRDKGVRRYGFHGLSYEWIAHCLKRDYPHLASGRVIAAHLGNGASVCAMRNGVSVDTTMGMTALEGLPMGTRCGSIDPGIVIYMMRELHLIPEEIEHILYEESGLKGLSGMTNDVKTLIASNDSGAHFAIEHFAFKAAQNIAAMAVSIGGIDDLVFTGGIGENAPVIRKMIVDHLDFLGPFGTCVIPANEERAMARSVFDRFGLALML